MREKAKQLVTLLKDEERLREERIHALKTKEKMAQTSSGEMGEGYWGFRPNPLCLQQLEKKQTRLILVFRSCRIC